MRNVSHTRQESPGFSREEEVNLKELPYQDGINWKELEGKPAIFNWNGKPMAGTLYLDGFSNLVVRELPGYMPVLYVWPDNTTHVNVKCVTDFHFFGEDTPPLVGGEESPFSFQ